MYNYSTQGLQSPSKSGIYAYGNGGGGGGGGVAYIYSAPACAWIHDRSKNLSDMSWCKPYYYKVFARYLNLASKPSVAKKIIIAGGLWVGSVTVHVHVAASCEKEDEYQ